MKVSKRELWFVFGILAVLAVYVFYQYLYSPQLKTLSTLRKDIKNQELSLKQAKEKLRILQGVVNVQSPEKIIAKSKDANALEVITFLADNITDLKLNLISLKPFYETPALQQAKKMTFDIILEGTYNQLYKFVNAIEMAPNLLVIDAFKLARKDSQEIKASISFSSYY